MDTTSSDRQTAFPTGWQFAQKRIRLHTNGSSISSSSPSTGLRQLVETPGEDWLYTSKTYNTDTLPTAYEMG